MPTKGLSKCALNEEYKEKMRIIREKLEEIQGLVNECEIHLPGLKDTKNGIEETLDTLEIAEEYYGLK